MMLKKKEELQKETKEIKEIKEIKKLLKELGFKKDKNMDITLNTPYFCHEIKTGEGYSLVFDEYDDENVETEHGPKFAGAVHHRNVRVIVLIFQNGLISLHEYIDYTYFPYTKKKEPTDKKWELDEMNINYWSIDKFMSNTDEILYYLHHFKNIDIEWNVQKEIIREKGMLEIEDHLIELKNIIKNYITDEKYNLNIEDTLKYYSKIGKDENGEEYDEFIKEASKVCAHASFLDYCLCNYKIPHER